MKASIHSLPTEIKTRIAEICHLQDENIRNVFARLRCRVAADDDDASDDEETGLSKLGPFAEDRSGPKSLPSLSCVSKEWRDIALKILLRKVTGRDCSKPIFLFAVAPQYGHLVEEVHIVDMWAIREKPCSTLNILLSLAYLPNVRKVALPSMAHVRERLVKEARSSHFPVESASPAFVASALRRLAQHAEDVQLPLHDLKAALSCVRGAGLTALYLLPTKEDLPAVLETIHTCPNLCTLRISTSSGQERVFMNAASLPYPPHPTLRRLEIHEQSGGAGLHDFIHRFFPNLEELKIYIRSSDTLETAGPPDLRHFALPRLQQLKVSGDWTFSVPLVRQISPAFFPALRTCTCVLPCYISPDLQEAFVAKVVDTIVHLRDQQADRAVPLKCKIDSTVYHDREKLQTMLEGLGIVIGVEQGGVVVVGFEPASPIDNVIPNPPDQILIPEVCRTDKDKVEDLDKIISTSLDRIRDLKDAAVAVGDRFQISRIAEALQEGEWLCVEREC